LKTKERLLEIVFLIALVYVSYQIGSINNLVINHIDVSKTACQNVFKPLIDKELSQDMIPKDRLFDI